MRALILMAGASLAISACGKEETAENTANVDEIFAAENIATNDTTAIDAAMSDAANMAADTDITLNAIDNDADTDATDNAGSNDAM